MQFQRFTKKAAGFVVPLVYGEGLQSAQLYCVHSNKLSGGPWRGAGPWEGAAYERAAVLQACLGMWACCRTRCPSPP
jgi:hypothetical protein